MERIRVKKKPIVVEAIQFTGNNTEEVIVFAGPEHSIGPAKSGELVMITLEGTMLASDGDWIIKGAVGEIYPVKDDIFLLTYETVDEQPVFDIENYMKSPSQCGFCGSGDIDAGFFDADSGTGVTKVKCDNCGAEWQDYYELKGVSDVYAPDGTYIGNVEAKP